VFSFSGRSFEGVRGCSSCKPLGSGGSELSLSLVSWAAPFRTVVPYFFLKVWLCVCTGEVVYLWGSCHSFNSEHSSCGLSTATITFPYPIELFC
jgi:hypothetical protein